MSLDNNIIEKDNNSLAELKDLGRFVGVDFEYTFDDNYSSVFAYCNAKQLNEAIKLLI